MLNTESTLTEIITEFHHAISLSTSLHRHLTVNQRIDTKRELNRIITNLRFAIINNDYIQISYEFRTNKYLKYYSYTDWVHVVLQYLNNRHHKDTVFSLHATKRLENLEREFEEVLNQAQKLEHLTTEVF